MDSCFQQDSWFFGFVNFSPFPFFIFQIREKSMDSHSLGDENIGILLERKLRFRISTRIWVPWISNFMKILGFFGFCQFLSFSFFHFPKREKSMDSHSLGDENILNLLERKSDFFFLYLTLQYLFLFIKNLGSFFT